MLSPSIDQSNLNWDTQEGGLRDKGCQSLLLISASFLAMAAHARLCAWHLGQLSPRYGVLNVWRLCRRPNESNVKLSNCMSSHREIPWMPRNDPDGVFGCQQYGDSYLVLKER